MRGIMVHSLMSRGASFDEAYAVASKIREQIRGRESVRREELAAFVDAQLGEASLEERPLTRPREIQVVSEDGHPTPFSKGVLAQSLLAAAVSPDDAFDVAREIEAALLLRDADEVEQAELRALAVETLRQRSERAAQRYRVWREFQHSERPMVLLLGGAAGVGKSALAQEVAHRLGIARVTSTDAIRQVMRVMLSPDIAPALHASSFDAHEVAPGLETSIDPVVDGFRSQAATVDVGLRGMIDRAISENATVILEGVSILPGLFDPKAYAGRAHVIFLVVATLTEGAFSHRFAARGRDAASRPPHRYLENLDEILRIQDYVLEMAELRDVPIVDNSSFDDSVLSILRHVTETLRKQGGFGEEA